MTYHEQYAFDSGKNKNAIKQLTMKIIMLRVWQQFNKENSPFKLWSDITLNFDELTSPGDRRLLKLETSADKEAFVKDFIYVWNHLGGESWIWGNENFYPYMIKLNGDDGTPKAAYKCSECGTLVLVDRSHEDCVRPVLCPECCNIKSEWEWHTDMSEKYAEILNFYKRNDFALRHPKWTAFKNLVKYTVAVLFNPEKKKEYRALLENTSV